MSKNLLAASLFSALLLLLAADVQAGIIYTQGPTPNTYSRSDEPDFGKRMADDFELAAPDTVRSVSWKGIYYPTNTAIPTDNFTIYFYADAGNSPGALLASFNVGNAVNRTATGSIGSWTEHTYRADIPTGLPVAATTKTWISIVNNTTPDPRDWAWATQYPTTPVLEQAHRSSNGGATWPESFDEILSFTLHDDYLVPEPSSCLLAVVGLLVAWRRIR